MADQHYNSSGHAGASIIWYPNQPTRERIDGFWQYVWRGWCLTSSAESLAPAYGTGMNASPTNYGAAYAVFLCDRVVVRETEAPDISDIELYYQIPSGPGSVAGDIEQSVETADREISIAAAYDAGGDLQDRAIKAKDRDEQTITVPTIRYEYAELIDSFNWTEGDIVYALGLGVGEIGSPSGLSGSVTADQWMFRGKSIRAHNSDLTKVSEHWEYSPIGWK